MCPKDGYLIFQNSELICGNMGKGTIGGGNKTGLIYRLIQDNGT